MSSPNKSRRFVTQKFHRLGIVLLFSALLSSCQPNGSYETLARTLVPQYDDQNQQVLTSLPIPPHTTEISSRQSGIVNGGVHSRVLEIEYDSQEDIEKILDVYDAFLLDNGWQLFERQDINMQNAYGVRITYISNTACITINYLSSITTATPSLKYSIIIWHDFFSQPFSVPTPTGADLCWDHGFCYPCPPFLS